MQRYPRFITDETKLEDETIMKVALTFITALLLAPLAALQAADTPAPATYDEPYRPQFHFTPPVNWLNDPVGMFYYEGEYHLHY